MAARRGVARRWLAIAYAGPAAFFALEAVSRAPGEAASFRAGADDAGTTRLIATSYGLALTLPLLLQRFPGGRLPRAAGPAGAAAMAAGLALRTWSMRMLGNSYSRTLRTSDDQVVVDRGPYRAVRHPGYLGSLLVWAGFGLTAGSAPAAAAVGGLMGEAYRRRIEAEERMLRSRFGDAYARYAERTWRLIPFVW